jgi:exodeoxyribonuclease VII large subunit
MSNVIPLAALTEAVSLALDWYFDGKIIKIKAEITDVKKYPYKKWCFLKLVEKQGEHIIAEFKGLVWQQGYAAILVFEQQTGQQFVDGLEIVCDVKVSYNSKYGLSLELVDIDASHTIGSLALEKEAVIKQLLKDYPQSIRREDDVFYTYNNQQTLPLHIQKIALITAPNSDGERDFKNELLHNKYGFSYLIHDYLCTIQGPVAVKGICEQLTKIKNSKIPYDIVVIVRGGGSNTDFKAFDTLSLALMVAQFTIPILTGIGHDRNSSITDLMARQLKTPTKVANFIIEQTIHLDAQLEQLKQRINYAIEKRLLFLDNQLKYIDRLLTQSNFDTILQRGFAVVYKNEQIITTAKGLKKEDEIKIMFQDKSVTAIIQKIIKHESK